MKAIPVKTPKWTTEEAHKETDIDVMKGYVIDAYEATGEGRQQWVAFRSCVMKTEGFGYDPLMTRGMFLAFAKEYIAAKNNNKNVFTTQFANLVDGKTYILHVTCDIAKKSFEAENGILDSTSNKKVYAMHGIDVSDEEYDGDFTLKD